jgi:hypothetical protein
MVVDHHRGDACPLGMAPIASSSRPNSPNESRIMKIVVGLSLAILLTTTATACGGGSKDKAAAESTTSSPIAAQSPTTGPEGEDKVVYHDAFVGNDVTVAKLRTVVAQMPKSMSCEELLTGAKAMGNTYPNGEELYLRICKEVPRK